MTGKSYYDWVQWQKEFHLIPSMWPFSYVVRMISVIFFKRFEKPYKLLMYIVLLLNVFIVFTWLFLLERQRLREALLKHPHSPYWSRRTIDWIRVFQTVGGTIFGEVDTKGCVTKRSFFKVVAVLIRIPMVFNTNWWRNGIKEVHGRFRNVTLRKHNTEHFRTELFHYLNRV